MRLLTSSSSEEESEVSFPLAVAPATGLVVGVVSSLSDSSLLLSSAVFCTKKQIKIYKIFSQNSRQSFSSVCNQLNFVTISRLLKVPSLEKSIPFSYYHIHLTGGEGIEYNITCTCTSSTTH